MQRAREGNVGPGAPPADQLRCPPVARVEPRCLGVDLGEPPDRRGSAAAELQDLLEAGAAGHAPDRVAPPLAAPGSENQALVHGRVAEEGEIERHWRAYPEA